jgi:hypothetical protein
MAKKSKAVSTEHQQARMLKALAANHGNVAKASKATGISRQSHYNWYRGDKLYAGQFDLLRHECHEEFKEMVMEGIRKKVQEGNTTILALCYKKLFSDSQLEMMEAASPFKERLTMSFRYVSREDVENREKPDPFSAEGMAKYEAVLQRHREERAREQRGGGTG